MGGVVRDATVELIHRTLNMRRHAERDERSFVHEEKDSTCVCRDEIDKPVALYSRRGWHCIEESGNVGAQALASRRMSFVGLDVSSKDGFVGLAFVTPAGTFTTEITTEMADDLAKRLQAGALHS